jgi:DNA-directed RNA polymerase specialized sigma24 family protein
VAGSLWVMLRSTGEQSRAGTDFEDFVRTVEPKLRIALVALYGPEDGREATAEALAYAWEHRDRVMAMAHPAAYLLRVGRSRTRRRKQGYLQPPSADPPTIEPGLARALERLSDRQRLAVMLCLAQGWTFAEAAELMGVGRSTVQQHLDRALRKLRGELGVIDDVG